PGAAAPLAIGAVPEGVRRCRIDAAGEKPEDPRGHGLGVALDEAVRLRALAERDSRARFRRPHQIEQPARVEGSAYQARRRRLRPDQNELRAAVGVAGPEEHGAAGHEWAADPPGQRTEGALPLGP